MAFLLLLHEKMRLQRKVNKLTLRECQMANKKERITKNIKRIQDMYSKKQTYLQKQADLLQKQFTTNLQNSMGLGTQGQMFNPYSGGLTSFVVNQIGTLLSNTNGFKVKEKDGSERTVKFSNDRIQQMMQAQLCGGLKPVYQKKDEKDTNIVDHYVDNQQNEYNINEYNLFQSAMQQAQMNQSQAQSACQTMSNQYTQNISVWLEAQQAKLEEEQDAALLPLEMQETEYDLERESCETQLADAKARLESIKQACSEGIKDSAPTFGIG